MNKEFATILLIILYVFSFIKIAKTGAVKNPFTEYEFSGGDNLDQIFNDELSTPSELDNYIISMNRADSNDYLDHRRGFVYEGDWVRFFNYRFVVM